MLSSKKPTRNIVAEPSNIGILKDKSTEEISNIKVKAMKKENPPARAIGFKWIFRSLGKSIAPANFDILREGRNKMKENKIDIGKINKYNKTKNSLDLCIKGVFM